MSTNIHAECSYLKREAFSLLLQRFQSEPNILDNLPVNELDFCTQHGISLEEDTHREASEKSRAYVLSRADELLKLARAIDISQSEKSNSSYSFLGRLKYNPKHTGSLMEEFKTELNDCSDSVLFDILIRIKKDPNRIDSVTFDSHHAPLYLDRESHINTRSSMQLEGVYNSLRSHSHKKEEASK